MTLTLTPKPVAHDPSEECYGCIYGQHEQVCSACSCQWSGGESIVREWCNDSACPCHDPEARECGNCGAISTDWKLIAFPSASWTVCSVCASKWANQ